MDIFYRIKFSLFMRIRAHLKIHQVSLNVFPILNDDGNIVFHNSYDEEVFSILNNQADN